MYPYFWGGTPSSGLSGGAYELLAVRAESLDLPEGGRPASEEPKDETHSEEDLRRMPYELMLRR